MAYVAITSELINRVHGRINRMQKSEIASAYPNLDRSYKIEASYIHNLGCWGKEHVHLIAAIPKDWLSRVKDSNIAVTGEYTLSNGFTAMIKTSVSFEGMDNAFKRPSDGYYNYGTSELTVEQLKALPDGTPGVDQLLAKFDMACGVREITNRWEKISLDIDKFLKSCKSLNEAVKLFPGLKMYLDPDDVNRLERKIERKPRTELTDGVDTAAATAAAVAAKLMGALA